MFDRIFTGMLIVLTGVLLTWAEVVAGVGMTAPDISNPIWLNSEPLRPADLKGKVVMVEFWTFGCHNCRNVEPYVSNGTVNMPIKASSSSACIHPSSPTNRRSRM